jgi:serine/threonine protein kinase
MSQDPETNDYIMVLQYVGGGTLNNFLNLNFDILNWEEKMELLGSICGGLEEIHQNQLVHRDFHTGNILCEGLVVGINIYISDMGLCGEVNNEDETKIYGVLPYVAPEVLNGNPYTQAADIYSFGMIMYFMATGRQPFQNCAHDKNLALSIYNGVRPVIYETEAPKCYIDLMNKCWDPNPDNRPSANETRELIELYQNSYTMDAHTFKQIRSIKKEQQHHEIRRQFKESEEYRQTNLLTFESRKSIINVQAVYTSHLLNPLVEDLPEHDNGFSDDIAVEDLLLEHMEHTKHNNSNFSDDIAVQQILLQHMMQEDS